MGMNGIHGTNGSPGLPYRGNHRRSGMGNRKGRGGGRTLIGSFFSSAGRSKNGKQRRSMSRNGQSGLRQKPMSKKSQTKKEKKNVSNLKCSLTLFSMNYHRGTEMRTTNSKPDLGSFADKAVSARMEGSCCWTLFQDQHYRGSKVVLYPGRDYKSATSLGSLLTE